MSNRRVVVVGTTPDYVEMLSRRFPDRIVFITDQKERRTVSEASEYLADLTRIEEVKNGFHRHLAQWHLEPSGVACFDCESLYLAAVLAKDWGFPFASPEAVAIGRSKYLSKELWRRAGVTCPRASLVHREGEALDFVRHTMPAIMKPLTGSGSELVFACFSEDDVMAAYQALSQRLARHTNVRMYASDGEVDTRRVFLIEEMIQGTEYSCDFMVNGGHLDIIRIARKLPAHGHPTGTIQAYILPAALPPELGMEAFGLQLLQACQALGLGRTMGMVDFIVRDGSAYILELTPRPGGDCLPWLIQASSGFDILKATLDLAEGQSVAIPTHWEELVGLRLIADRGGVIRNIDTQALTSDNRVRQVYLKHGSGHRVVLPPDDYDSRMLGHVIFRPANLDNIRGECQELSLKLKLDLKKESWSAPAKP